MITPAEREGICQQLDIDSQWRYREVCFRGEEGGEATECNANRINHAVVFGGGQRFVFPVACY